MFDPHQYSCLENPMDRGAWRATVPWGYKESNMTERLTLSLPQPFLNPLTLPQFSSVQSFSHVQLFATSWTAARQASLSITNFQSLLKPRSIESVMPSNHRILCRPLLLPPSIFPSIRVFSNEATAYVRYRMLGAGARG